MRSYVVTSLEEMADHEEGWERLRKECGGSVYSSYPLSKAWLESFEGLVEPRIIMVEEKGELVGIAPFALQSRRVAGLNVRLLSMVGDLDGMLCFSNLRLLAAPGSNGTLDGLMGQLKGIDWNMIRAFYMDDTDVARAFIEQGLLSWKGQELAPSTSMMSEIPAAGDLLSNFGKRTRKDIRMKLRELESEGRVKFRAVPSGGLEQAVDIYAQHHVRRWSEKGGSMFRNERNKSCLANVIQAAYSKGIGYAYELLIDDDVASQLFGFLDGRLAHAYMTGMSHKNVDLSPGKLIWPFLLTEFRNRGSTHLNMGEGGQEYKKNLGGWEVPLLKFEAKRGIVSLASRVKNGLAPTTSTGTG